MRIISRKTLIDFYAKQSRSMTALEEWFKKTRTSTWRDFSEVKESFRTADYVGGNRYVFNIHGNDFRLIAMILFKKQTVYIRFVGTHKEYERIKDISKI